MNMDPPYADGTITATLPPGTGSCRGGFGRWTWAVSRAPSDLADLIHAAVQPA